MPIAGVAEAEPVQNPVVTARLTKGAPTPAQTKGVATPGKIIGETSPLVRHVTRFKVRLGHELDREEAKGTDALCFRLSRTSEAIRRLLARISKSILRL